MNKWLTLNAVVGSHVALSSFASAWWRGSAEQAPWLVLLSGALWYILVLWFIHQMCAALPGGRMSPARAVGLMLVPGLQPWAAYRIFTTFAEDFNQHVDQPHYGGVPRVARWLLVGAIPCQLVPVVGSVMQAMVILNVANAVTALAALEAAEESGDVTPPPRVILG